MPHTKHMAVATRLRNRATRALAACISLAFVAGGVLGARHEAQTAHVRDSRGVVVHASQLSECHAEAGPADFHRQAAPDLDEHERACAIALALHQAASDSVARPSVAIAHASTDAPAATLPARDSAPRGVYRLAPKTSPPTIA